MPFAANAQLVITGIMDGPLSGGLPKIIEMAVLEDIADLSEFGIGIASNGGASNGVNYTFPADALTAGSFIYVTNNETGFISFFGFNPDYITGTVSSNGDDVYELFKNGVVVDVFGVLGTDGTGEPWEFLDGWAYRVNEIAPNGGVFVDTDFTYSGPNALDGESTNDTAETPFPLGTFTFGTVANESASWSSVKAMFN